MPQPTLYTVGHSTHPIDEFVALLQKHGVACLADVRSQPYSRWNPQYNREQLARALKIAGIDYQFLGDTLGGRPDQADLYDPGNERPNYSRQRETPLYHQGLAALEDLGQARATAMMCSEGDPDECHRSLLIVPSLLDDGFDVQHILPDGSLRQAEKHIEQMGFGF